VNQLQERLLALAGVFQAARLVQQLAREGRAERAPFRASVHSVLMLDAEHTAEVYGGIQGVALGLTLVRDKLGGATTPSDLEMAKYAMNTVQLAGALQRRPQLAESIRTGVRAIESQMAFFEHDDDPGAHPRLVEKLADLYAQTLSTVSPRVVVNGEQGFLANPTTAAGVRAALFAGVRSAVLWRQLGGSRLQLIFQRKAIATEATRLLAKAGR
jgi:high frequency lysogenization protein